MFGSVELWGDEPAADFDLAELAPQLRRLALAAKAHFQADAVEIVLREDGAVFACHEDGVLSPMPDIGDELLFSRPAWNEHGVLASAPLKVIDEHLVGRISVHGAKRPYDERLADILTDLAEGVVEAIAYRELRPQSLSAAADAEVAERMLLSFIKASPMALVVTDMDVRLMHASPRWLEEMGLDPADPELPGSHLYDLVPGSREVFGDAVRRCFGGETIKIDRVAAPTADGRRPWHRLELTPWRDADGLVGGMVMLTQDITDMVTAMEAIERAKVEAEDANRTKSEFLANMSHEIRTPMNGIIGMNALLMRTPLTSDQQKYAEAVRVSADCLLGIINDILDISKLEAGKVELESIDFSLARIIEDVAELLSPKAGEKGVDIAVYLDEGARRAFKGDPTRVRQVLLNLASNAIKFTEAGFVSIEAKSRDDGAGTYLRLEVADTGIGLTREAKAKLFQKFQQADGSITRKYGGTGLGLSISRQLVELMGGVIGVGDRPGGGSIFFVEMRLENGQLAEAQTRLADLRGRRMLVVDDTEFNRSIFARQLESEGVEILQAEDGVSAIRLVQAEAAAGRPLDAIVLDHMMPGMAGDQTARAIRNIPGLSQPKILLATSIGAIGRSEMEDPDAVDALVSKPVRHQALIENLARLLGAAEPGEGLEQGLPEPRLGHGGRILLAEDHEINTMLAVSLLEQAGYSVDCVVNGAEAVEAACRTDYDLILMDMQMPVLDGIQATRQIRAKGGPLAAVPIVALTANAMGKDQDACLAAGMVDFVSKPFDPEAFLATVARRIAAASRAEPILDAAQLEGLAKLLPPARFSSLVADYVAVIKDHLAGVSGARGAAQADVAERLQAAARNLGARRVQALAGELMEQGRGAAATADLIRSLASAVAELEVALAESSQLRVAV